MTLVGGAPIQNYLNVAGPIATVCGVWLAYHFGTKRARVDDRQASVAERSVINTEIAIALEQGAKIRDELRTTNAAQQQTMATQQQTMATLAKDNADTHIKVHDLNNKMTVMEFTIADLIEERDTCRADLAEVLTRVVALENGGVE